MSSENDVADRLLSEARKKTAKQDSPKMGKVALIIGIIAVVASPISILGWILGGAAVGIGVVAVRRPISMKRGKIAIALGAVAILVGVFFFTLSLVMS
jgi:predicted transporter